MRFPRTTSMTAFTGAMVLLLAGAPIEAGTGNADEYAVRWVVASDEDAGGAANVVAAADEGVARGRVFMLDGDGATGADAYAYAFSTASVQADDTGDAHSIHAHSIEVRIVDGDATVTLDGKEVPAARVVRAGDAIVVLDENGDEIRKIHVGPMTGDRTIGIYVGEGDKQVWFGDAPQSLLPEPKVMLGLQLGTPGRALERHLRLDPDTTTMVTALYEGLPAHAAGIGEYDIITTIDGGTPADPATLRRTLAEREPGDTIGLGVISAGERKSVRVKVEAYDRDAMRGARMIGDARGMALLGPSGFGRQVEMPGDQSLFELDFGNVQDLNRFFLDDSNRLFEMPKGRMRLELKGEEGEAQEVEVELDTRLSTLDRRLAALEEMLDALLKEARKSR